MNLGSTTCISFEKIGKDNIVGLVMILLHNNLLQYRIGKRNTTKYASTSSVTLRPVCGFTGPIYISIYEKVLRRRFGYGKGGEGIDASG